MCVGGTELCSAVAVSVSIGVALCAQLAGYLWGRVGILEVEVHMGGGVGGSPTVEDLGLSTLVYSGCQRKSANGRVRIDE